jgi:hypothetical protein
MQLIATIEIDSDLYETVKYTKNKIYRIGQNRFKLSHGQYICNKIVDLEILKKTPGILLTMFGINIVK